MELATISVSRSKLRQQSKQITVGFEDVKMVGRSVNRIICGLYLSGSCEQDSETSNSIKRAEFLV